MTCERAGHGARDSAQPPLVPADVPWLAPPQEAAAVDLFRRAENSAYPATWQPKLPEAGRLGRQLAFGRRFDPV